MSQLSLLESQFATLGCVYTQEKLLVFALHRKHVMDSACNSKLGNAILGINFFLDNVILFYTTYINGVVKTNRLTDTVVQS